MNEDSIETKIENLIDRFSAAMNNIFDNISQKVNDMRRDFEETVLKTDPRIQELQNENDDLKRRLDEIFDIQVGILDEIYENSI